MAGNNTKMNISYTIKAIDNFTKVHKRLERQLERLERSVNKVSKDVDIDINANTRRAVRNLNRFERKLDDIEVDLRLLSEYEISPEFDAENGIREIARLEKKLARLKKEAEMELEIDTDRSEREVNELTRAIDEVDRKLQRLNRSKARIFVQASTDQAVDNIDKVYRRLRMLPRVKRIFIEVQTNAKRSLDRVTDVSRDLTELLQGFGWGFLLTGLAPATQGILGALGAIASATTPVALGIAGLAAVGVPALTEIEEKYSDIKSAREKLADAKTEKEIAEATKELNNAMSSLSKNQRKAVKAMDEFGSFFKDYSKQFENINLDIFSNSLEVAQKLLKQLEPAIKGVATAVNSLLEKMSKGLESDEMVRFFSWLGETAGPNLEKLGTALGNFLVGFADMMVAFDPLAQGFLDWLLDLSESFRQWASTLDENQAFQDFVTFCQENGPLLISFLGNLAGSIWRIIEAASPFAMEVLEMVNGLLELFNSLMDNNDAFNKFVGFVFTALGVITMILGPLVILYNILKVLLSPALKLVGKLFGRILPDSINKTGGTIGKNNPKIDQTKQKLDKVSNSASKTGDTLAKKVDPKVNKSGGGFQKFSGILKGPVGTAVRTAGRIFTSLAGGPIGLLITVVIDLASIVFKNWNKIKTWTVDIWGKIKSFLKGIDLKQIGKDMMEGMVKGIKSMGEKLVNAAKGVVKGAIEGAKRLLGIKSPSRVFFAFGEFVDMGFINGMLSMSNMVEKASEEVAGAALPNMGIDGKYRVVRPPKSELNETVRVKSDETNQLLKEFLSRKPQVIIQIEGDNEAIRAYVNEQNAIDAIVRRF
jgi:hypothetical protein